VHELRCAASVKHQRYHGPQTNITPFTTGHTKRVSSLTLAALGDLGWYLPNYDRAHCVWYGRNAGCEFISSRCSIQRHDYSVPVAGPSSCTGLAAWEGYSDLVERKCQWKSRPCAEAYQAATGMCDSQCATGTDDGEEQLCAANVTVARAPHVDHTHDDGAGFLGGDWWWGWVVWLVLLYSLLSLTLVVLFYTSGDVREYERA
jgi:hypothetical protein